MPTDIDITLEPMAALTREHHVIDEAVETAKVAAEAAVRAPGDADLAREAMDALHELHRFLESTLAMHIAKEELVLFPALRLDAETNTTIDELIEQHDEVKVKRAALRVALAGLDDGHDEVREGREGLANGLSSAGTSPTPEVLTELWESVRRLHWILQGHFGDEEDDLFLPAESLLSAETLARLTAEVEALEAAGLDALD